MARIIDLRPSLPKAARSPGGSADRGAKGNSAREVPIIPEDVRNLTFIDAHISITP
jgi:hypothetical protein